MQLKPCPHCGSEAELVESHGSMKSWPSVNIVCQNKDCYGSMHVTYDEFSCNHEELKAKMVKCWNNRVAILKEN